MPKKKQPRLEIESRNLEDAVNFFAELKETVKVRGNVSLSSSVATIQQSSLDEGLTPEYIRRLVKCIINNRIPDSVCNKLIRCLIPRTTVPCEAIILLISWMCTSRPPRTAQVLLIRWLVLIYEVIDNMEKIHALYGIIFHFLKVESMCRHVCHLLYLMTRREDVKLFRVQALVQLQQTMGTQSYIIGLLAIYKLYCPHMISITLPTRSKTFFPQNDRQWAAQIREIQDRQRHTQQESAGAGDGLQQSNSSMNTSSKSLIPSKLDKHPLIPAVYSVVSISSGRTEKRLDKVPFSQIRSFNEMLQNLEMLELPNQMAAVLNDHNLQYLLLCSPDPTITTRLAYWLDHVLYQEFLEGSGKLSRQEELLIMLINFSDFLQEGVPACENFLTQYLHTWNGLEHRAYILKLITRFRLYKFDELHTRLLEPLSKLFYSSSVYCKCQIILCLTELVRNFGAVELQRYRNSLRLQKERNNVAQSFVQQHNSMSIFNEEVDEFDGLHAIVETLYFIDDLCSMGSRLEHNNVLFMHCSLMYYEMVTGMTTEQNLPAVVLPSKSIIYHCLFSHTPMVLLRLCSLICSYGAALQNLCSMNVSNMSPEDRLGCTSSTAHIQKLNRYILDLCDSLWRGRAVSSQEKYSIYRLLDDPTAQKLLPPEPHHSFSLRYHPALLGYTYNFIKENKLPQTASLHGPWKQYRDQHLEYLEENGAYGVKHFIRTFLKRPLST